MLLRVPQTEVARGRRQAGAARPAPQPGQDRDGAGGERRGRQAAALLGVLGGGRQEAQGHLLLRAEAAEEEHHTGEEPAATGAGEGPGGTQGSPGVRWW